MTQVMESGKASAPSGAEVTIPHWLIVAAYVILLLSFSKLRARSGRKLR